MPKFVLVAALAIIFLANVVRFLAIDTSPPGFFDDEASNAAHLICLRQTGHDANGKRLPFFSDQFEPAVQARDHTGRVPVTHLYPGAAWVAVFGGSVASVRAFSAMLAVLTVAGIALLTSLFLPMEGVVVAALCASVSPWLFQMGRFSGMVIIMLPFLLAGTYFFLRSNRRLDAVLAGLAMASAVLSYPAARVQMVLLFPFLCWLKRQRGSVAWRFPAVTAVTATVCLVPLAWMLLRDGDARAGSVTIFSSDFLSAFAPQLSESVRLLFAFSQSFYKHLSPGFLFFTGDSNLRHSTGWIGELGWAETTLWVIAGGAAVLAWHRRIVGRPPAAASAASRAEWQAGALAVVGIVCGFVPSALTWESVPHALRAAGAMPFFSLLAAVLFQTLARRWRGLAPAVVAIAGLGFGLFLNQYFGEYAYRSRADWLADRHESLVAAARAHDWHALSAAAGSDTPQLVQRYYRMAYGGESCDESARAMSGR